MAPRRPLGTSRGCCLVHRISPWRGVDRSSIVRAVGGGRRVAALAWKPSPGIWFREGDAQGSDCHARPLPAQLRPADATSARTLCRGAKLEAGPVEGSPPGPAEGHDRLGEQVHVCGLRSRQHCGPTPASGWERLSTPQPVDRSRHSFGPANENRSRTPHGRGPVPPAAAPRVHQRSVLHGTA